MNTQAERNVFRDYVCVLLKHILLQEFNQVSKLSSNILYLEEQKSDCELKSPSPGHKFPKLKRIGLDSISFKVEEGIFHNCVFVLQELKNTFTVGNILSSSKYYNRVYFTLTLEKLDSSSKVTPEFRILRDYLQSVVPIKLSKYTDDCFLDTVKNSTISMPISYLKQ